VNKVIKKYQSYIDSESSRVGSLEKAWLELYADLSSAPDPKFALSAARALPATQEKLTQAEYTAQAAEAKLESFKAEHAQVVRREVSHSKLQARVSELEAHLEEMVAERVRSVERTMKEEMDQLRDSSTKSVKVAEERAKDAAARLAKAEGRVREMEERVIATGSATDERLLALQEQLSSVESQRDDLFQQLASATEETEGLQQALVAAREGDAGGGSGADRTATAAPGPSQQVIETYVQQLQAAQDELKRVSRQLDAQTRAAESAERSAATQLETAQRTEAALRRELELRPTRAAYDAAQERLQALRAARYDQLAVPGLDALPPRDPETDEETDDELGEADDDEFDGGLVSSNKVEAEPDLDLNALEEMDDGKVVVLLRREVVRLRSIRATLGKRRRRAARRLAAVGADLQAQQKLVNELEEALRTAQLGATGRGEEGGVVLGEGGGETKAREGGSESLVDVVASQRDRFRDKASRLEQELRQLEKRHLERNEQCQALSDDNVKLYTKIRYLESYSSGALGVATSTLSRRHSAVERRYEELYEDKADPFARFSDVESQRHLDRLSTADRVVLRSSSFFLTNSRMRLLLATYLTSLHLSVFYSLYRMTSMTSQYTVVQGG
jgi:homeobox protein cut-like